MDFWVKSDDNFANFLHLRAWLFLLAGRNFVFYKIGHETVWFLRLLACSLIIFLLAYSCI